MSFSIQVQRLYWCLGVLCFCIVSCTKTGPRANDGVLAVDPEKIEKVPVKKSAPSVYVKACEAELGSIPKFSCSEGAEIEFHAHKDSQGRDQDSCDTPLFAHSPQRCSGRHTVGSFKGDGQSEWSYLCAQQGKVENWRVSFIGYNRGTGATCFFDGKMNKDNFKAKISAGADEGYVDWATTERIASQPETQCVTCHTSYPFVRTPAVLPRVYAKTFPLLTTPESMPILSASDITVPVNISEDFDGASRGETPYWVVRLADFELHQTALGRPGRWQDSLWRPRGVRGTAVKSCTGCHRVGGYPARIQIVKNMVGLDEITLNFDSTDRIKARNNHWTLHARVKGILEGFKPPMAGESLKDFIARDRHMRTLANVPPCLQNTTPDTGDCWLAPLPDPNDVLSK
jgi:hypothetical protein